MRLWNDYWPLLLPLILGFALIGAVLFVQPPPM